LAQVYIVRSTTLTLFRFSSLSHSLSLSLVCFSLVVADGRSSSSGGGDDDDDDDDGDSSVPEAGDQDGNGKNVLCQIGSKMLG